MYHRNASQRNSGETLLGENFIRLPMTLVTLSQTSETVSPSTVTYVCHRHRSRIRPGGLPAVYWQSTCSLYSVSLYLLALLKNTVTGCVRTSPVKISKIVRARAVSIWSSGYRQTISTFCCFKMPMDRTAEGSRLQCTSTPLSAWTMGIFTGVSPMEKCVVSWVV